MDITSEFENHQNLRGDFNNLTVSVNSYPAVMYVESTIGCPYKCVMCEVPQIHGHKSIDIGDDVLERVSPYFRYLKILGIHGGGEPLLSRKLGYFVQQSVEHGFYLHMNTTGFFLKPVISDRMLEAKLHLIFSIHAGRPETYLKIMGNDLERVIQNITYLTRRSAELGRDENEFWFSYIVVRDNLDEIEDFLELAAGAGIRKVRFMKLIPNKKTVRGAVREEVDYRYVFHEQFNADVRKRFLDRLPAITSRAEALGISIKMGSMEFAARNTSNLQELVHKAQRKYMPGNEVFPLVRRRGDCLAPWVGQVQINQKGDVNLCCSTKCILGNVMEQDFEEIWNGPRIRRIRSEFREGLMPRVCGACKGLPADEYGIDLLAESGAEEEIV